MEIDTDIVRSRKNANEFSTFGEKLASIPEIKMLYLAEMKAEIAKRQSSVAWKNWNFAEMDYE